MKKYDSPVCEITIIMMSDIITASSFGGYTEYDNGDMDNGENRDIYYW